MSLDSNSQSDISGVLLPRFTSDPTLCPAGVDFFAQDSNQEDQSSVFRNPNIFPHPFNWTGAESLENFNHLRCTVVVPDVHPRQYWWPMLFYSSFAASKLACKG